MIANIEAVPPPRLWPTITSLYSCRQKEKSETQTDRDTLCNFSGKPNCLEGNLPEQLWKPGLKFHHWLAFDRCNLQLELFPTRQHLKSEEKGALNLKCDTHTLYTQHRHRTTLFLQSQSSLLTCSWQKSSYNQVVLYIMDTRFLQYLIRT